MKQFKGQLNKRRNGTAIWSVNVAHMKLIEHTTSHFYKDTITAKTENKSIKTLSKEYKLIA